MLPVRRFDAILFDLNGTLAEGYDRFGPGEDYHATYRDLGGRELSAAALRDRIEALLRHPGFTLRNPNKVRAVLGVFAMSNPTAFHAADGSGYRLLADQVIALDALNPQVAARIVGAFNPWTRHDAARRDLMKSQLQRIAAAPGLSGDVAEIVENALGMERLGAA